MKSHQYNRIFFIEIGINIEMFIFYCHTYTHIFIIVYDYLTLNCEEGLFRSTASTPLCTLQLFSIKIFFFPLQTFKVKQLFLIFFLYLCVYAVYSEPECGNLRVYIPELLTKPLSL
jgi:hypothetical protein